VDNAAERVAETISEPSTRARLIEISEELLNLACQAQDSATQEAGGIAPPGARAAWRQPKMPVIYPGSCLICAVHKHHFNARNVISAA
jgi:hypothetical protein